MEDFEAKAICILGRQPALGLAELESLYGPEHLMALDNAALLNIDAGDINFSRLGGTIKVARLLDILPATAWPEIEKYLLEAVPRHLKSAPGGKFTLGISAYGLEVTAGMINRTGMKIKKAAGRPMRVVPNKSPALNSAQVLHNKLTTVGAWELVLLRSGDQTLLAQTIFVQDIEAYAARDQARPARDARVGMLPPKLAQILVNLAMGESLRQMGLSGVQGAGEQRTKPYVSDTVKEQSQPATPQSAKKTGSVSGSAGQQASLAHFVVLDPFCGTGVILQEALLMGYSVYGTDIDERMVEYSKRNIQWLVAKKPEIIGRVVVEKADAVEYVWPGLSAVSTELYLGRALSRLPAPDQLQKIVLDVNTIAKKFLNNLGRQLKPGRKAALALPAWQIGKNKFNYLPLIDDLTDMGYNIKKFKHISPDELVYHREGQIVARQLIVLEKS